MHRRECPQSEANLGGRCRILLLGLGALFAAALGLATYAEAVPERPKEHVWPAPAANPNAVVWHTEAPPALPEAGDIWVNPRDQKAMVYLPAGVFLMGSPDGEGDEDERPQRAVYLDAFWIDKTEVTNAEYTRFMASTGHRATYFLPKRWNSKCYDHPDQPVVGVGWDDAVAYARWAGKRLPTEAEWEKAARGTDRHTYPWGNEWDVAQNRRCNFSDEQFRLGGTPVDDGYDCPAPVGRYPTGASPYGCLDMAGNVWEWCSDWYAPDYYQEAPLRNPQGPESGRYRVIRGGSWAYEPSSLRCATRDSAYPECRQFDDGGFRCVLPVSHGFTGDARDREGDD